MKQWNYIRSPKRKTTKNKHGENVPHLQTIEVLSVHYNIVNNDYQPDSRVLYIFVPNKPLGSILEIFQKYHIFLKTFDSEFQAIEAWLTDQNSQPLQIQYRINLTLAIK